MLAFVYNKAMDIQILIQKLSAPAGRALLNEGLKTLEQVAMMSRQDLLKLHGMGKTSFPIISQVLSEFGLALKDTP